MKILVDLIHPANYHYYKYFIKDMKLKKNEIIITARKKDILQELLMLEDVTFINTGKGNFGRGAIGKLLYLLYAEFLFFVLFIRLSPDIVLSFGSTPCAHNAFLFRIPHISFDDTEHAKLNRKLYASFADVIFTPTSFYEEIGKNQIRFNSFMELFYLHPCRFEANSDVLTILKTDKNEKKVLFRLVSWEAYHDIGQQGLSQEDKVKLVQSISKKAHVFISSEGELPKELAEYKLNLPVNRIHDFLIHIDLYIGEGGTMASECAMLGIPSIYINSLPLMGYLKDAKKFGLLFHLNSIEVIKNKILEILSDPSAKIKYSELGKEFIKGKIDPTALLVWFIENYPESKIKLLQEPEFQNNFVGGA